MLKSKKKITIMTMLLSLIVILTGCVGQEPDPIATEDGKMLVYTKEEATEKGGYFIKKGEDHYEQLLSAGVQTTPVVSAWYTGLDHLVPEIASTSDALVYISKEDRPDMYEFTELKDMGHTLGIAFKEISSREDGSDAEYTFNLEVANNTSPAANYIRELFESSDIENIKIAEVNDIPFRDTMLTPDGFMKGLTKGAMYKFWFYEGTVYKSINLMADSRLFLENMTYYSKTHREEKDTYFTVGIPQEMPSGYYLIDQGFMFKYNPPKKSKKE